MYTVPVDKLRKQIDAAKGGDHKALVFLREQLLRAAHTATEPDTIALAEMIYEIRTEKA